MSGFTRILVRWLGLRARAWAERILWALQIGAAAFGGLSLLLAAVYVAHLTVGSPRGLGALPWLEGPVWATLLGLALRLLVAWILYDAARAGRRKVSRARGDG